MRLILLLCLTAVPGFAAALSGFLVDSKCYASEERNHGPNDTILADRDMDFEIRYCSPHAKTRNFAVVRADWTALQFDPAGNAKAADLVRKVGRRKRFEVVVNGELEQRSIRVVSIAAAN